MTPASNYSAPTQTGLSLHPRAPASSTNQSQSPRSNFSRGFLISRTRAVPLPSPEKLARLGAPFPRSMRYSQTHSPRPSAQDRAVVAPSRCRLATSYPPFSNLRKCRNCAEIDASPYRVNARSSPSVSHVSQSAAASITSRIISRCDRSRLASYIPAVHTRALVDFLRQRRSRSGRAPRPPVPPKFSPASRRMEKHSFLLPSIPPSPVSRPRSPFLSCCLSCWGRIVRDTAEFSRARRPLFRACRAVRLAMHSGENARARGKILHHTEHLMTPVRVR